MRSYSLIIAFIISLNLLHVSTLAQVYTLQDTDVVIENGNILSCSYDFSIKNIIIPEVLQGQTVIGIAEDAPGVFASKGIEAVEIPATIQYIGVGSFTSNEIEILDLSQCTSLVKIGGSAFEGNKIIELNLNGCTLQIPAQLTPFSRLKLSRLRVVNLAVLCT